MAEMITMLMSDWLDDIVTARSDHKCKRRTTAIHLPGIGSSGCWVQLGVCTTAEGRMLCL